MDDVRFWSVVASLGPELAPARLAMVLSSLTPSDLRGFCLHLDEVEAELDTRAHRTQAGRAFELRGVGDVRRRWATADDRPSADFDELLMTVVAHGRDTYRAVLAVPPLLSGGWPTNLGRQFVLALANALRGSLGVVAPA